MFEKFSNMDVDSAGQGGEYTVQVRFSFSFFFFSYITFFFVCRLVLDGLMEPYFGLQVTMVRYWRHLNALIFWQLR